MVPQPLDFLAERLDVLEAAVHRGEAHVCHLVQVPQLLHDQLAHHARGNFALAEHAQLVADAPDGLLDRLEADRALLQRLVMPLVSLRSSNGSRLPSLFTTRGISSSAVSKVVKRSPQLRHSRRRRIWRPSAASRESVTLVSMWPQKGQCIEACRSHLSRVGLPRLQMPGVRRRP